MISLIFVLFRLYEMVIVVRVILSWARVNPANPFVTWLDRLSEPVLEPIRRLIHTERLGFDFSPLVALFLLELIQRLVLEIII